MIDLPRYLRDLRRHTSYTIQEPLEFEYSLSRVREPISESYNGNLPQQKFYANFAGQGKATGLPRGYNLGLPYSDSYQNPPMRY